MAGGGDDVRWSSTGARLCNTAHPHTHTGAGDQAPAPEPQSERPEPGEGALLRSLPFRNAFHSRTAALPTFALGSQVLCSDP